jgi:AcrR family transcriptional regulator
LIVLLERGFTVQEAAEIVGVSKQAIYYRFRKDALLKKRAEEAQSLAGKKGEKRSMFINYLKTGASIEVASSRAGLSKKHVFKWMVEDKVFRELVDDALSVPDMAVERKLLKKALAGNIQAIALWLRQRRPNQWREPK